MLGNVFETRRRLAESLGRKSYNRLIACVAGVRQLDRLRFWQHKLLEKAHSAGVVISTVDQFLAVFDGAIPVSGDPATREHFLLLLEELPYGGFPFDEMPTQWMADAWETERIREELSGEMARTVGELGELAYDAEYLSYLSRALTPQRQVELYTYLRDTCRHETREDEFRPSFERAFPACVSLLPPPLGGDREAKVE
jgi:hypothetical protein